VAESRLVQVISSPSRLKIAGLLSTRPRTLGELASVTGMSVQGVLKHLAKLNELGLLTEAKIAGPGPKKVYFLKGFNVGDFSIGDLTIVKLSRNPDVGHGPKRPAAELGDLAEETILLRSRIRAQTRRLGRIIDELVANDARLRAVLDSLQLSEREKIVIQTVFTEDTIEDAEKSLSRLRLKDPRNAIDRALAKLRRTK
jgi:DNA-binding transcriptional ArsR family regulator